MRDINARFVARVPLFDRLGGVDCRRTVLPSEEPYRALTLAGVRESVASQLQQILGQRSSFTLYDALVNDASSRSVTNYGLPDFCGIGANEVVACQRLADAMARTITAYEPRLQNVSVTLERPGSGSSRMDVTVNGVLVLGNYREPISFPGVMDSDSNRGVRKQGQ